MADRRTRRAGSRAVGIRIGRLHLFSAFLQMLSALEVAIDAVQHSDSDAPR